ncbi:unnamed protein product, partial [Vitis vinifera]
MNSTTSFLIPGEILHINYPIESSKPSQCHLYSQLRTFWCPSSGVKLDKQSPIFQECKKLHLSSQASLKFSSIISPSPINTHVRTRIQVLCDWSSNGILHHLEVAQTYTIQAKKLTFKWSQSSITHGLIFVTTSQEGTSGKNLSHGHSELQTMPLVCYASG